MSSKTPTSRYTENCSDKIQKLQQALDNAEAILVGAGAGLSAAAGFTYSGKRFKENFSDFIKRYHFSDMYSAGFYPFASTEEYWAYWSRYIFINRYRDKDNGTYKKLFELIQNKDYFILTTNVDHQFQKAGFSKHRLFYMQGDYGLFQCSIPCHMATYDNEETIRAMIETQQNSKVPAKLFPVCPICGKPMVTNLRTDDRFVQDKGWYTAADRYKDFLRRHQKMRILFLELGVGNNTPGIIKIPFWQMTEENSQAFYVCINQSEPYLPLTLKKKALYIRGDISTILSKIKKQNI